MPTKKKESSCTFEENMSRLEEISRLLSDEKLSLEESLSLYEEGTKLVKLSLDMLNKAEKKIKTVSEKQKEM